jgi:hypothetical protein
MIDFDTGSSDMVILFFKSFSCVLDARWDLTFAFNASFFGGLIRAWRHIVDQRQDV